MRQEVELAALIVDHVNAMTAPMTKDLVAAKAVIDDLRARLMVLESRPLPRDGEKGADGAPGPRGLDGMPGEKGADGAPGPMGPPGPQGIPGRDGRDGIGLPGPAGEKGAEGAPGPMGPMGQRGESGLAGKDGTPGRDGKDGLDGLHGKDGADGLGFDDLDLVFDDARGYLLRAQRGPQVKEWAIPLPFDAGVWQAGRVYPKGAGVTVKGAWWIAQTETSARPGEETVESRAWRLSVKGGRDGKDGKNGRDGIDA